MSRDYPHLNDTPYPFLDNVDPYEFENTFDYTQWSPGTQVKLLNVAWDSDFDNLVGWESTDQRDQWFASQESPSYDLTNMTVVDNDGFVKVPIPFNVCNCFNYIVVTNPVAPVPREVANKHQKWFFFIEEVERLSPNATRLHLVLDIWTSYFDSIEINSCMLERGHAPMAETSLSTYLAAPYTNSNYLLAPDVNFSSDYNVASSNPVVLNGTNVYAVMVTTSNPSDAYWGNIFATNRRAVTARTPVTTKGIEDAIAVPAANLATFLGAVPPQFLQTVVALFYINAAYLTLTQISFMGQTCYRVSTSQMSLQVLNLTKAAFNMPSEVSDVTKLYTYPYSWIQLSNQDGPICDIKVEDMASSTVNVETVVSLALPFIGLDGFVKTAGAHNSLSFRNVEARSYSLDGSWTKYPVKLPFPCYAVYQSAGAYDEFANFYGRLSSQVGASNTYKQNIENTNLSMDLAEDSARASAALATNQQASNYNVAWLTAANNYANYRINGYVTQAMTVADSEASQKTQTLANQQTTWNNQMSTLQNAVSLNIPGALSDATFGALNVQTSNWYATAGNNVAINLNQDKARIVVRQNAELTAHSNQSMFDKLNATSSYALEANNLNNELIRSTAYKTGQRSFDSAYDAFCVNRETNFGQNEVTGGPILGYQHQGVALQAPKAFGANSGDSKAAKPVALVANVVTQPTAAIKAAGDQMLRYGYTLGQYWEVDTLTVMPKFTYWQMSDLWATYANVPTAVKSQLKAIFAAGTTVWSDPDDVCGVSIYDN